MALRKRHDTLAGILLGLACAVKLFPGLLVLYLLMRRCWRALIVMVLMVILGLAAPLVAVATQDVVLYLTEIAPANVAHYAAFPINSSLTGAVSRLLVASPWIEPLLAAPLLSRAVIAGLSLSVLGILLWQLWQLPATQLGDDVAFSGTCVAMILLSPLSWQHSFTLLLLPLAILVQLAQRWQLQRLRTFALLVFIMLALPDIDITRWLMALYAPYKIPWYAALVLSTSTLALFLLWAMLTWAGQRERVEVELLA